MSYFHQHFFFDICEEKGKENNDNRLRRIRLTLFSYKAVIWLTKELCFSKKLQTVEWLLEEHEAIIKGVLQGKIGIHNLPRPTEGAREKATSTTQKTKCQHLLTEDGNERRIQISKSSDRCLDALCSKLEMKQNGYALDCLLKIRQLNNPGLRPSQIQTASTTTVLEQPCSITPLTVPQASLEVAPQESGAFEAGAFARASSWLGTLGEVGEFTVPPIMPQLRMEVNVAVRMNGGVVPSEQTCGDAFKQNYGVVPIQPNYGAVSAIQKNYRAEYPIEHNCGDFLQCSSIQEENSGGVSETSKLGMEGNGSVEINARNTVEQNHGAFLQCDNLKKGNIGGASKVSELQMEGDRSVQRNGRVTVEQNYGGFPGCAILLMENISSALDVPQSQKYGTFLHCIELQNENIGSAPEIPQSHKYGGFFQFDDAHMNSRVVPFEAIYEAGAFLTEANGPVQMDGGVGGIVPVEHNPEAFFEFDNLEEENTEGIVPLEQKDETLLKFNNLQENIEALFNCQDLECR